MDEKHKKALDILIKAYDGTLWSENMIWGIEREEQLFVEEFIDEYNKDNHLDLSVLKD